MIAVSGRYLNSLFVTVAETGVLEVCRSVVETVFRVDISLKKVLGAHPHDK
jgi:hypothetical protein